LILKKKNCCVILFLAWEKSEQKKELAFVLNTSEN